MRGTTGVSDRVVNALKASRRQVSDHEAAHCVVAEMMGIRVKSASVFADEKLGYAGRTEFTRDHYKGATRFHWLMVFLAGSAAEHVLHGLSSDIVRSEDIEQAFDAWKHRQPIAEMGALMAVSWALVRDQRRAIRAVGAELARTKQGMLTGDEIRALIQRGSR